MTVSEAAPPVPGFTESLGSKPAKKGASLAIVAPFYNEAACIPLFLERLEALRRSWPDAPQIVLVDDGSSDGSGEMLEQLTAEWPRTTIVRCPVNRGQAAALLEALRRVEAPLAATLDGDGQNDPADIPAMMRFLESSGSDMVVGIRASRRDSALRRAMSRAANWVRSGLLGDGVSDSGCALKVFRREVIGSFLPIRTLYSFMPAMAAAAGFRVAEMAVRHHPRAGGTSSYGMRAFLWRPLLDLLGMWWFLRRRIPPGRPRGQP